MTARPRTCFMHIGTPKTGTTSLQRFLMRNRAELAKHGVEIPLTSWLDSAPCHRAVTAAARINPDFAPLDALLDEMTDAPSVVLSNETYSGFSHRTRELEFVQEKIEGLGFTVVYLIYFRDQAQLMAAYYTELIKQGFDLGVAEYVDTCLNEGGWRSPNGTFVRFDYSAVLQDWGLLNREIRPFSYDELADGSALVFHFLSQVAPSMKVEAQPEWTNHRLGPYRLQTLRLLSRHGETHPALRNSVLAAADDLDRGRSADILSPADKERVGAAFQESNRSLLSQWGVRLTAGDAPPGLRWREIAGAPETEAAETTMREMFAALRVAASSEERP